MARIETLGQLRTAALGILDQAEAEIRQAVRLSGYDAEASNDFAPMRIREYAGDMERLRDLLPPTQIKERMQTAVDAMHRLSMLDADPQDAQLATQTLNLARTTIRDMGRSR